MSKSLIIILLFITTTLFSKSIEGVYFNDKLGEVIVKEFGEENKGYFVEIKKKQFFFKPSEDVYIHFYHKNKEEYQEWVLKKQKRNLVFTRENKEYKLKKKETLEKNKSTTLTKNANNQLFDLNTSNYCAGEFYDLSPKGFLPFNFNRGFIKSRNLNDLHIKWNEGSHTSEETTPRYDFFYTFDSFGNTAKMKANTYYEGVKSKNEIEWVYYYKSKEKGLLDSVVMHTRVWHTTELIDNSTTIYVDKDHWICDEKEQKIGRIFNFKWTYKDNGLPLKWVGEKGKREGFSMDFVYEKERLSKMVLRNEKHKKEKVNEFTFSYSSIGVLTSVTRIKN